MVAVAVDAVNLNHTSLIVIGPPLQPGPPSVVAPLVVAPVTDVKQVAPWLIAIGVALKYESLAGGAGVNETHILNVLILAAVLYEYTLTK
jgi:hypothetical protein